MDSKDNKPKMIWKKIQNLLMIKQPYIPIKNPFLFQRTYPFENRNICQLNMNIDKNIIGIYQLDEERQVDYNQLIDANQLDIDNTGNFYWLAEEMLAYFCIKNYQLFNNIEVLLEIGAGKSGLAGLSVILISDQIQKLKNVYITDGNYSACRTAFENYNLNISLLQKRNFQLKFNESKILEKTENKMINVQQLIWQKSYPDNQHLEGSIAILISDCLFFENFHIELLNTIKFYLNNESKTLNFCLIAAPSRGGSRERFLNLAKEEGFISQIIDIENFEQFETIKKDTNYVKDRHDIQFFKLYYDYAIV